MAFIANEAKEKAEEIEAKVCVTHKIFRLCKIETSDNLNFLCKNADWLLPSAIMLINLFQEECGNLGFHFRLRKNSILKRDDWFNRNVWKWWIFMRKKKNRSTYKEKCEYHSLLMVKFCFKVIISENWSDLNVNLSSNISKYWPLMLEGVSGLLVKLQLTYSLLKDCIVLFRKWKLLCFYCIYWVFKACVCYFLSNFYISPNDSPSKTMKNVFYLV